MGLILRMACYGALSIMLSGCWIYFDFHVWHYGHHDRYNDHYDDDYGEGDDPYYIVANNFAQGISNVKASSLGNQYIIYDVHQKKRREVSLDFLREVAYWSYEKSKYQNHGDENRVSDMRALVIPTFLVGLETSHVYEDLGEVTDVNLLASDKEFRDLAFRASKISYTYEVPIKTAFSLVSLGIKIEKMLVQGSFGQRGLTKDDRRVLLKDMEHFTGMTLQEMAMAESKGNTLERVSRKLGIDEKVLEARLLPELFGVVL